MSWSVNYIGTPEKITAALNEQSTTLTGQSKIEFDAALPNLVGLLASNFTPPGVAPQLVKLDASGSGSAQTDGTQTSRTCQVTLTPFYAKLLT
jgi:hypothetical protein